jgi:glycosyltransferase involved in cell wall biosynthesis
MCLPSVVDSWSLTILESWSTGLGAVVYNAGGPGELVRHNVDGWKIPPGDIAGLTHLLGELEKQPEICWQWGKSGQSRIASEFALKDAMDRLARAIVKPLRLGPTND